MRAAAAELSVVLVVGPHRARGARALRSILAQEGPRLEVVYYDTLEGSAPPLAGSDDPRVRRLEARGRTLAACRAEGGLAAAAPLVAYVEEHCEALPGWAAAVRRAFEGGAWAGVGGSFVNGNGGVGFSDTAMLLNYGPWLAPGCPRGEARTIAGHNSAFRREVLEAHAADLPGIFENELVLDERLVRGGRRLWVEPDALLAHWNEETLGAFLRGHWHFNRGLAATRARYHGMSLARRAWRVLVAPLLPAARLAEQLARGASRGDGSLGQALRALPSVIAYHLVSVAAQTMGYALGPGGSYRSMSDYELETPRPDAPPGRAPS